jgi:hypothetical protein
MLQRAPALRRILGRSGCHYNVERLLQDKPGNQGRVYLATYITRDDCLFKVLTLSYKLAAAETRNMY